MIQSFPHPGENAVAEATAGDGAPLALPPAPGHDEPVPGAPLPIGREDFGDRPLIFERRLDRVIFQDEMKRIFFVQVQIDREPELQLLRTFRKKTGGDGVFEDIARIADGRFRRGREIESAHSAEAIAPGKEAHVMGRKPDRLLVAVGGLVAQPQFHKKNLLQYGKRIALDH